MIRLTVLYPNLKGSHFDWDYYINVHTPLAKKCFGETALKWEVDRGTGGGGIRRTGALPGCGLHHVNVPGRLPQDLERAWQGTEGRLSQLHERLPSLPHQRDLR